MLDPAGPISAAEKTILLDALAIMLTIVVPVIITTLGFVWWFRRGNTRARYLPHWEHSGRIELVIWSIPALVVIFVGGIAWIGSHELDPAQPIADRGAPLEVEVVSLDWKWLFIYPQQEVATVNQLTIPAGVPVHFSLTSASVMNTFFIPQLGSQIYTMNGMATQLNLLADNPGNLRGFSGHYSGDGFADMHFAVQVVRPHEFDTWVDSVRSSDGVALNAKTYAALAVQGVVARPAVYRTIEPNLFHAILMQALPPGPGPVGGRHDTTPKSPSGG